MKRFSRGRFPETRLPFFWPSGTSAKPILRDLQHRLDNTEFERDKQCYDNVIRSTSLYSRVRESREFDSQLVCVCQQLRVKGTSYFHKVLMKTRLYRCRIPWQLIVHVEITKWKLMSGFLVSDNLKQRYLCSLTTSQNNGGRYIEKCNS